jgi:hypothetical protein
VAAVVPPQLRVGLRLSLILVRAPLMTTLAREPCHRQRHHLTTMLGGGQQRRVCVAIGRQRLSPRNPAVG